MQSKYKIALSLSQELDTELENIQKYVHLYKLQTGINYDFVNGYSFELENDVKTFIFKDYLSKKRYAFDLEMKDKLAVQSLKNKIAKNSSSNWYDLFEILRINLLQSLALKPIINAAIDMF